MSILHWLLAVSASNYFEDNLWALFFTAWFIGGCFSSAAGLAIHEAAHSLVLTGKWKTVLVGFIAECPLFASSYLAFKHYHMPHHAYITLAIDDSKKSEDFKK